MTWLTQAGTAAVPQGYDLSQTSRALMSPVPCLSTGMVHKPPPPVHLVLGTGLRMSILSKPLIPHTPRPAHPSPPPPNTHTHPPLQDLLFYAPPEHAGFYPELVNLLEDAGAGGAGKRRGGAKGRDTESARSAM
jgi:hypothetical protein